MNTFENNDEKFETNPGSNLVANEGDVTMAHSDGREQQERLVWQPYFVAFADELSHLHWHHTAMHFCSQSVRKLATEQPIYMSLGS